MCRSFSTFWLVLVGALLSAPLLTSMLVPQGSAIVENEKRPSATLPGVPLSLRQLRAFPIKLDAYFRDHFGMRNDLIHIHALLNHRILKASNTLVQIGDRDWFFLRGDEMLQQSAGLLVRKQQVFETAEVIARVRDVLASKGIRLVFASPPNSATIYGDLLPAWARNQGRRTEYDLLLDALADRGVKTVDLRLPLRAAREQGAVYFQHDTHWSDRGAVIAFNAIAAAMGHNKWQLNPSIVLGPLVRREGGDLARMLDIAQDVTEWTELVQLPFTPSRGLQAVNIAVLGDSFTGGFGPLLSANAAGFTWIHHDWCGFDWDRLAAVRPDEVWWMPTERYMLCQKDQPKGIPIDEDSTTRSVVMVAR